MIRAAIVALALCTPLWAAELRLEWDALPDGAEGVTVHVGPAPGQYDRSWDVGATTETVIDSPDLDSRIWIALSAYNGAGRSDFSPEAVADCWSPRCEAVWRWIEVERVTYECRPDRPCERVKSSTVRRPVPVVD